MSTGLARVTVNAPGRRVDVALPEHVPLADLLPEVLRHAGVGLADDGERHGGWLLRRADGAPLVAGQGLVAQGVRDGELLHLVPARTSWPEPEYDDVVEAIADAARRRGAAWSGHATRAAAQVAASVLLGAALFALLRAEPGSGAPALLALGVALLLVLAGVVASRAYGDGPAGAALGGYAMPYAFVGGGLLVASGDPIGAFRPLPWLGAPELLVGSVALLLVALLGAVGVAAGLRIFAGGVVVGLLGALAAVAGFFLPAGATAGILMSVLVCGIGAVPLFAIRFGKLPVPVVTLTAAALPEADGSAAGAGSLEAARERPDRRRVFAAVARTEELLTGLLIGYAVLAAAAAAILVGDGAAGRLLVAVSAAGLLLRSRLFVTMRQRVPLVVAGLAGFAVLAAALVSRVAHTHSLVLAGVAVVLGLITVAAGATYSRRPPSPYLGRAADALEMIMVISVVPVACAVLGLYARARGLLG
jgi:type VII secretion integral membrane protein EccD